MKNHIYLLSYATSSYKLSQLRLISSARKFGIEKFISISRNDLQSTDFYKMNRSILDQKKGGGYWLWKPYYILDSLKKIRNGDILIYADTGMEIVAPIEPLIDLLKNRDIILFKDGGDYRNSEWIKKDCFTKLSLDNKQYANYPHIQAGFQIYKKTKKSISFVSEWLSSCVIDDLITDKNSEYGIKSRHHYKGHRHDQAILSLIAAKHCIELYRDPTQWGNYLKQPQYRIRDEFISSPYRKKIDKKSNYGTIIYHHRMNNTRIIFTTIYQSIYKLKQYLITKAKSIFSPFIISGKYRGYNFYFSKGTSLLNQISGEGYEYSTIVAITKAINKIPHNRPVILDIGANIGLVTLDIMSRFPSAKIYAFEPGPHQSKLLDMTIRANRLSNSVILVRLALSNQNGMTEFSVHQAKHSSGDGIIDTRRAGHAKTIKVKVSTLDYWWRSNNKPKIDLIKIDTEGAELLILQGANKCITKNRPIIVLEINSQNIRAYPHTPVDVIDHLTMLGYSIKSISTNRLVNKRNIEFISQHEDMYIARPINVS